MAACAGGQRQRQWAVEYAEEWAGKWVREWAGAAWPPVQGRRGRGDGQGGGQRSRQGSRQGGGQSTVQEKVAVSC